MAITVRHDVGGRTLGNAAFETGQAELLEADRKGLLKAEESQALRQLEQDNSLERMRLSDELQTGRLERSDELQRERAGEGFERDVDMLGRQDELRRQTEEERRDISQAEYKQANDFGREVAALTRARDDTLKSGEFSTALDQLVDQYGEFINPKLMSEIIQNGGLLPERERVKTPVQEAVEQQVYRKDGREYILDPATGKVTSSEIKAPDGADAKSIYKIDQDYLKSLERKIKLAPETRLEVRSRLGLDYLAGDEDVETTYEERRTWAIKQLEAEGYPNPANRRQAQAPGQPSPQAQTTPQQGAQQRATALRTTIARAKAGDKDALKLLESMDSSEGKPLSMVEHGKADIGIRGASGGWDGQENIEGMLLDELIEAAENGNVAAREKIEELDRINKGSTRLSIGSLSMHL